MSNFEHSKGPWSFSYNNSDSSGGGQWYELVDVNENPLFNFTYNCGNMRRDECMANARLASFAPQLLEMLIAAVNNPDDPSYWLYTSEQIIKKATRGVNHD